MLSGALGQPALTVWTPPAAPQDSRRGQGEAPIRGGLGTASTGAGRRERGPSGLQPRWSRAASLEEEAAGRVLPGGDAGRQRRRDAGCPEAHWPCLGRSQAGRLPAADAAAAPTAKSKGRLEGAPHSPLGKALGALLRATREPRRRGPGSARPWPSGASLSHPRLGHRAGRAGQPGLACLHPARRPQAHRPWRARKQGAGRAADGPESTRGGGSSGRRRAQSTGPGHPRGHCHLSHRLCGCGG